MWSIWSIESHKVFQVFINSLINIGNYMWLRNILGNLGELMIDRKSYKVLYWTCLSSHTFFLDGLNKIHKFWVIYDYQHVIYVYDENWSSEFIHYV